MDILFDSNKLFFNCGDKINGNVKINNEKLNNSKISLFLKKDEYWFKKGIGKNLNVEYIMKPNFGFLYPDTILFFFEIPQNIKSSFEYSGKDFIFYIRYYLEVNCEINDESFSENKFLIILPNEAISQLEIFQEKKDMISVYLNKKNFYFNDNLKCLIEFENKSNYNFEKIRISIIRQINCNKKDLLEETIFKNKYKCQIKKNEKILIKYNLKLKEEKFLSPNYFIPSINSSFISCLYLLNISFCNDNYYDHIKINIPINICYSIREDYKEKEEFDIQNEIIFNPDDSLFVSDDDSIINNRV